MLDSTTRLFRAAVAVFSVFLAAPVMAQAPSEPSTRASVLDQAREALATQSAPPRRSLIERGLYWYDNQSVLARGLGGWKGFRIAGGDFPAGAGMKFGLAFDKSLTTVDPDPDAPNRLALATRGAYSTRGYKRVNAAIDARNLGGRAVDVNVFGTHYEFPQEDYFGPGMESLESNRTNYLLEATEAGATVRWRVARLDFGGGASYLQPRVGSGTDSRDPSTEDVFGPATAPGLGSHTDFVKAEASAAFDWRDNPSYPHAGGRYQVTAARFDDYDVGAVRLLSS